MRPLRFRIAFTTLVLAMALSACKPAEEAKPATPPAKAAPKAEKAADRPAPSITTGTPPSIQIPATKPETAAPPAAAPETPPGEPKAEPTAETAQTTTTDKPDLSNLSVDVKKNLGIKEDN